MIDCEEVILKLTSLANPENVQGMARFGIKPSRPLGISVAVLSRIAREIGRDHDLALQLWNSGIHEARILACLIDDPVEVTPEQMESWVLDLDSWDVCDQVCNKLFDRTPWAWEKAASWCRRSEEFVRRAGFSLIATLAVHDKTASDVAFLSLFPLILDQSVDGRNFVKKSVNWALRQIGKRNRFLNERSIRLGRRMGRLSAPSARWIARDALKELTSDKVQAKLKPATRRK